MILKTSWNNISECGNDCEFCGCLLRLGSAAKRNFTWRLIALVINIKTHIKYSRQTIGHVNCFLLFLLAVFLSHPHLNQHGSSMRDVNDSTIKALLSDEIEAVNNSRWDFLMMWTGPAYKSDVFYCHATRLSKIYLPFLREGKSRAMSKKKTCVRSLTSLAVWICAKLIAKLIEVSIIKTAKSWRSKGAEQKIINQLCYEIMEIPSMLYITSTTCILVRSSSPKAYLD